MKKIISVITCIVLLTSVMTACNNSNTGTKSKKDGKLNVWTATGMEKILLDGDYSARYGNKELEIKAFRNEKEAGQIIISPEYDVAEYDITVNDLRSAGGAVLPKDSFTVYNEKYVNVEEIMDIQATTTTGYYPDAILPFETAKEYGENKISADKNQGLWITLKPSKEQQAGVFSGNFTLTVGDKSVDVPVTATVYDYTLSDGTHTKSSFGMYWKELEIAELDASVEMQEKYYDFMLDHRINAQHLPGNDMNDNSNIKVSEDAIQDYFEMAEKYTNDVRCTSFNLPFAMGAWKSVYKTSDMVVDGADAEKFDVDTTKAKTVSVASVDYDFFETFLKKMGEYSASHGINLFKKASTYFVFFDEYDDNGTEDSASYNLRKATIVCEKVSDYLAENLSCEQSLKDEIVYYCKNVKHKVVGRLNSEKLLVDRAICVPTIDNYDSASNRKLYADFAKASYEESEIWTYTCTVPKNPYPTYHIEDALISSRLLNWMNYEYNVIGTLYWETTLYTYRTKAKPNDDLQLQDYYGLSAHFPTANGDGYLMYPGREYGIDGPVSSIRLESICDGVEDYDLLYELEQLYKENARKQGIEYSDADFDSVYKLLNKQLYDGAQVRYRENSQDLINYLCASREMLADLIVSASKFGTVIEKYENSSGKGNLTISAPENVDLTVDGQKLTGEKTGELVRYEKVTASLDNDENYFNLSIKNNGNNEEYDLSLMLGKKSMGYLPSNLTDKIEFTNDTTGASTKSVEKLDGEDVLKLDFKNPLEKNKLIAKIDMSSMEVNAEMSTITLSVYLYGDTDVDYYVYGQSKANSSLVQVYGGTLKAGEYNTIEISVASLTLKQSTLSTLRLSLETANPVTIGLVGIVIAR